MWYNFEILVRYSLLLCTSTPLCPGGKYCIYIFLHYIYLLIFVISYIADCMLHQSETSIFFKLNVFIYQPRC